MGLRDTKAWLKKEEKSLTWHADSLDDTSHMIISSMVTWIVGVQQKLKNLCSGPLSNGDKRKSAKVMQLHTQTFTENCRTEFLSNELVATNKQETLWRRPVTSIMWSRGWFIIKSRYIDNQRPVVNSHYTSSFSDICKQDALQHVFGLSFRRPITAIHSLTTTRQLPWSRDSPGTARLERLRPWELELAAATRRKKKVRERLEMRQTSFWLWENSRPSFSYLLIRPARQHS